MLVSPQESKGSVSLSVDIAYMCILSQITCNCYSKVLNAFNVSRSVLSMIYEAWILVIRFFFVFFLFCFFVFFCFFFCFLFFFCQLHHIAFDKLKSHTQLPCPGTQSINIALKIHCVILNFSIANIVINKKSYFRLII